MEMLQVFGRHAAVQEAERRLFDKVQNLGQSLVLTSKAGDFQMSTLSHSGWMKASADTTWFLNCNVKEIKRIHFFVGAVYEMTFNDSDKFSQSQIAVLATMPTHEDIQKIMRHQSDGGSCRMQDSARILPQFGCAGTLPLEAAYGWNGTGKSANSLVERSQRKGSTVQVKTQGGIYRSCNDGRRIGQIGYCSIQAEQGLWLVEKGTGHGDFVKHETGQRLDICRRSECHPIRAL
jgi:hypothetical protein